MNQNSSDNSSKTNSKSKFPVFYPQVPQSFNLEAQEFKPIGFATTGETQLGATD